MADGHTRMNTQRPGNQRLVIIGMPAVGKTAVGARLAQQAGLPFIDLDAELERESGRPVADMIRRDGEAVFRIHEAATLDTLLQGEGAVIATGGGAAAHHQGIERMRQCAKVLWLDAPIEVLTERALQDGADRPLLGDTRQSAKAALADLQQRRQGYYARAHAHVDATQPLAQVVQAAERSLAAPRLLATAADGAAHYPVLLHGGDPACAVEAIAEVAAGGRVALAVDRGVSEATRPLYDMLAARGANPLWIDLPGGEKGKDLRGAARLWAALGQGGIGRDDLVVAVGGGATTDLVGFCAATWQRGVRTVLMPTTVLAMADASVGAKTAIDLSEGKNQVGAFHAPSLVWLPLQALATLPARQFRAGLAEIAKIFIAFDREAWVRLVRDAAELRRRSIDRLQDHLATAVALKAAVVAADPREQAGPGQAPGRALLNLGHTLGHAIEAQSRYAILHGEAVALGLCADADYSASAGLCDPADAQSVCDGLQALGLDTAWQRWATPEVLERVGSDKKRRGAQLWQPVLRAAGQAELISVELDAWRAQIQMVGAQSPRQETRRR